MEIPKIKGISSESYSLGRIDSFKIEIVGGASKGTEKQLILLLKSLGFNKKEIDDKLLATLGEEEHLFLYANKNLKAYLVIYPKEDYLILKLDTSLERKKIISTVEKYFNIPT
ncbi:MAG: hypothetical protein KC516_03155 [Nanoarchaeota archaeon]|nr:hypothetical protein [Nanoarchaeota archaeon]